MDVSTKSIYTDLDDLPIYNFMKCVKGELKYMYEDRRGKVTRKIRTKWDKLYNKYCELTYTNETLNYYKLVGEIDYLVNRERICKILIGSILKTPLKDCLPLINELSEWGLPIDIKNNLKEEINRCILMLNNSKNTIERKTNELELIKNKPVEEISLQAQKAKLHRLLSINVDLKSTSVTEWLAYWEEVKHLSTANNGK